MIEYEFAIRFADQLVAAGAVEQARSFVSSLSNTQDAASYLAWLAQHFEADEAPETALHYLKQSFAHNPTLQTYEALRTIAQRLEQWGRLEPQLLTMLEDKRAWTVLIDVTLDQEDIERAFHLLDRFKPLSSSQL